jgi:hypothetical protein
MVIDSHTHNFKQGEKYYSAEDLIRSMDKAEIDYSMLIADGTVGGTTNTQEAINICGKYKRLKPIGNIELSKLDDRQINTLVEYLKNGKIHGVKLYPGYENFFLRMKNFSRFMKKWRNLENRLFSIQAYLWKDCLVF